MKRSLIIHPFLFAVFPILFLYSHNVEQLFFSDTLLPLAFMSVVTILLVLLLALILKNGRKAAIIVSVFLILFFMYGRIYEIVQSWQGERWNRHKEVPEQS